MSEAPVLAALARLEDCQEDPKIAELERLLNDPDVPMHAARVWELLAEISGVPGGSVPGQEMVSGAQAPDPGRPRPIPPPPRPGYPERDNPEQDPRSRSGIAARPPWRNTAVARGAPTSSRSARWPARPHH